MRNLLVIDDNSHAQAFEQGLDKADYSIRKIHDSYSLATHVREFKPEVLIFNLSAVSSEFIEELNSKAIYKALPVMVFAPTCSASHIKGLIQAEVSFMGINSLLSASEAAIEIALARFDQIQALRTAMDEARSQLEDRKQIDRAKAILIKTKKFSEDQAYHALRKLAMDRNITLGEMARNVIAMAELLK